MRPSGAMMTCASAEASSAWLRMSTRPASAVCIARAAKAAKPLITASAITALVTACAVAPELFGYDGGSEWGVAHYRFLRN